MKTVMIVLNNNNNNNNNNNINASNEHFKIHTDNKKINK